ncbi:ligand-binding sensor domain-containing protein [Pleionea sediminis]|uniref:ligand-binding sensor domain-containing protein n=1 Tax=Pleionea sediminis TaxID=2569479 RepID=UPI0013DE0796|nr:two-component regulator propeller domain-containing protein [Pleionea sediminis]
MAVTFTNQLAATKLETVESFKHINFEVGLPTNRTSALFYDSHGYLWIATYNGLARYNGKNFNLFQSSPGSVESLNSSQVNAVYVSTSLSGQTPSYTAWVGMNNDGGLQIIENGKITKTLLDGVTVTDIKKINDTQIAVVLEDKLVIFNSNFKKENSYSFEESINSVQMFGTDLIVATDNGVGYISKLPKRLLNFRKTPILSFANDNNFDYLGSKDGLYIVAKNNSSSQLVLKGEVIRNVLVAGKNLLVGTPKGLIECEISYLKLNDCERFNSDQTVSDIEYDKNTGIVWASTTNNGVFQLPPNRKKIKSYKSSTVGTYFHSMLQTPGKKWIAAFGEGVWQEGMDNQWNLISDDVLPDNRIIAMKKDLLNRLWVGHFKGVSILDESGHLVEEILTNKIVLTIDTNSNDAIYIGTDSDGVYKYDYQLNLIDHIEKSDGLNSNTILSLLNHNGYLLIGTTKGFYKYQKGHSITQYEADKVVWKLETDHNGNLLIGTDGDGLIVYNDDSKIYEYTSENSNLPSNTISDIFVYPDSNKIAISTLAGLAYTNDISNPWFKIFDFRNGLYPKEMLRGAISYIDDKLIAQGLNGWTELVDFRYDNNVPVLPVYTNLEIPETLEHDSPLEFLISGVNHFDKFPITFSYSLNNSPMRELKFGSNLFFNSLPPGNNIIRVHFHSKSGSGTREFNVDVTTPANLPQWLILVLSLSTIFVGVFIYQYRLFNKKLEKSQAKIEGLEYELNHILEDEIEPQSDWFFPMTALPFELPKTARTLGIVSQFQSSLEMVSELSEKLDFTATPEAINYKLSQSQMDKLWYCLAATINVAAESDNLSLLKIRCSENSGSLEIKIAIQKLTLNQFDLLKSLKDELKHQNIHLTMSEYTRQSQLIFSTHR